MYTSTALPLLRFTNTYQALVSTVAAAAGDDTAIAAAPATTTAATPAETARTNHPRRRAGGAVDGDLPKADMILLNHQKPNGHPKLGAPRHATGCMRRECSR
ncbi:hypothetical protein GCM10009848_21340 [Micromonospora lupini]